MIKDTGFSSQKMAANSSIASDSISTRGRDTKEAATDPKFGEVFSQIQAKYGEKPEKPREIKKTLGKDDFLKIMITQMKNQDPRIPLKRNKWLPRLLNLRQWNNFIMSTKI
jgi:hypothetical protein